MRRRLLRVGVAGCGRVARAAHIPALARDASVELVALADCDARNLQDAARCAPHATLFADWRELFERSGAEAVVVCLPNALHAEAARAALARSRHVYLEKPLATNMTDARALVEAARLAPRDVVAMIGFNYRFNRLYEEARAVVAAGALGEIVAARTIFSTAGGGVEPEWKRARASGGGALLDLGSHHFDLVRFLLGHEAREVFAETWSRRAEDDCACVQMRLEGGAVVQSFFSTCATEEDRIEIYGSEGRLTLDRYLSLAPRVTARTMRGARLAQLRHGLKTLRRAPYPFEKLRAPLREPSFTRALRAFVAASLAGGVGDALPNFDDGLRSLALVEAAEESARERRTVAVEFDDALSG
jgi:predicted dehydrogenase